MVAGQSSRAVTTVGRGRRATTPEELDELWPKIKPERFQEEVMAFGRYSGKYVETVFYVIDNEVHHRGQGYVYLRALGVEPPYFWDR